MTRRFWVGWAVFLVVISGFVFQTSCAKKQVVSEPGVAPCEEDAEAKRLAAVAEAEKARKAMEEQRVREERLREEAEARREREEVDERTRFLTEHIYFEFDRSRLLPEGKEILRRNAKWLKAHPEVQVTIEGHCDERGTTEYNLALGDRRAQSAMTYLSDLGVVPQRLTTVSFGEEKPIDPGHSERAWAKNRRAQFVIR
ncbi:MAG: peptidoglycan-associated lipoprotein Pal [Thermodesulfobacteriota bacterium]|nr:peptidoglycan-associated lipoprotein Pal [Thermodesulfobacteriota bacterium]